ncbi:MAG TPA: CYCXC family (seleno)protein [Terriglobia bacterium]|nr:CYCXC family (seleno)protein [Terriglobia bacterium]
MRSGIRVVLLTAVAIGLSSFSVLGSQQEKAEQPSAKASKQETQPVPAYHKSAKDAKPLPRLLPPSTFKDRPLVARAYQIASEIPLVLAQQPCYCRCDKAFGHSSLLDCYASSHTAGCGICMAETLFAYQMTKQGKTPAEIREAIIRGDWKSAYIKQSK